MIRSRRFWEQRTLHPVARLLLIAAVVVLVGVAVGFIVASGEFTRLDLLAIAFYAGLAAFAWRPSTAAYIVMLISSIGVVFTGSGGDLLELAIALSLVTATCVAWVIIAHVVLLGALSAYVATSSSTLTQGGIYAIAGIAVIAFLAGLAFRLVAARETILLAERERVEQDLEAIAREEQERIADELHDGIAHDLTLILFHARALPKQPDDAARQLSLTTIEDSAEQALQSIQSLLSLMRDTATEGPESHPTRYDGNVVEAISSLGALLNDAGIPTRVTAPRTPLSVTPAAERVLTETAIEAVTNIMKHAPRSQSASIDILEHGDAMELVVTNLAPSSTTPSDSPASGRGLKRARQRLAQNHGELESVQMSDGWTLRATVPAPVDETH
ncbi:sensor histidine kinase [Microbacterium murale]|uniref:Signal transduction histidine kinase n=1 Tax=Microbacterium murale TaxID=1081040 RepID=A0ABU0P634_9MICO|nr:histidine kinase [Microbacterium murale]MDQ0642779.1 signal transduction histidine kinase [Microbacterium murale]